MNTKIKMGKRNYSEFASLMERMIHKYNQWESIKRNYGTDDLLSRAEIHTIVAIGNNPGINVTKLAEILGITKGAASQMIYKLRDKKTVEKKISPASDTEVILTLTEKGMINYSTHEKYHKETNDESLELLKDIPDPVYDSILKYLSAFENNIEKKLKETQP